MIASDHGIKIDPKTKIRSHGGDSPEETEAFFLVYSKSFKFNKKYLNYVKDHKLNNLLYNKYTYLFNQPPQPKQEEILQLDITSTILSYFDLSFPGDNFGVINPDLVISHTDNSLYKRTLDIQKANF